jgi:hypothetical protein
MAKGAGVRVELEIHRMKKRSAMKAPMNDTTDPGLSSHQ